MTTTIYRVLLNGVEYPTPLDAVRAASVARGDVVYIMPIEVGKVRRRPQKTRHEVKPR